ncbi:MAG TPA: PDZ domain-containing protein [Terriglobales bacterium]|nr:PDZ domain-containing protein [Terriglobales bacterium]
MSKYVLTSIVLLPLLLSCSYAAQNRIVAQDAPPAMFWSEDGDTSSYLGVDIADVTAERLSALKLKEEKGVEVTVVDQDAPAGKAGIKEHDVILTMNGTSVESAAQLRRMIHETPAGRIVAFGLSRNGQPITVKVQLADRQKEFSWPNMKDFHVDVPAIEIPPIDIPSFQMVMVTSSARSGLTVENITPQLGEFFGVKNGNGVLVRSVEKGSRAEKAGFRAGDVIVKVNDQPVHDTSDFTHAVKSRDRQGVSVGVVRDRKEQNLNLTLPQNHDSGGMFEDESLDHEPMFNAERAMELSELQNKVAQMRPQMELAVQQAAENSRKAAEEVRKSLCDGQKLLRQQSEKQREQFRKEQEQLKRELEQMSRQSRRGGLDI